MNLHQLQVAHEIVKHGFCLRDVATALYFSQNNVRKHIKDFEAELGLQVFERRGKTIAGLTAAGRDLMEVVDRIQANIQKLRMINRQENQRGEGQLRIGSTHRESRYVLPQLIRAFKTLFPAVRIQLQIGSPAEVKELLMEAEIDLGFGGEFSDSLAELTILKSMDWPLVLVVPEHHPLVRMENITLEALAALPIVTYHKGVSSRSNIDSAFAAEQLEPDIVLSADNDDVLMTYVELGLGIGILAPMGFDPQREAGLRFLDASSMFGRLRTRLYLRRGHALTNYVYQVMELLAPWNANS